MFDALDQSADHLPVTDLIKGGHAVIDHVFDGLLPLDAVGYLVDELHFYLLRVIQDSCRHI